MSEAAILYHGEASDGNDMHVYSGTGKNSDGSTDWI